MGLGERAAAARGARTKRYVYQVYLFRYSAGRVRHKNKSALDSLITFFVVLSFSYPTQMDSMIHWSVPLGAGTLPPG